MHKRCSVVLGVLVKSVDLSSVIKVGDAKTVAPRNRVFAVQREIPRFSGQEGNFEHPIYSLPIPQQPIDESIRINIQHVNPSIHVGFVDLFGLAGSSVFQIGSNEVVRSETRIRNIRQLLQRPSIDAKDEQNPQK